MQYAKLGNSALNVSRVCLGCMGFGVPEAGQHSWTLEMGVNFFSENTAGK